MCDLTDKTRLREVLDAKEVLNLVVKLADLVHHGLERGLLASTFLLSIPDAVGNDHWHAMIEPPEDPEFGVVDVFVLVKNEVLILTLLVTF